MKRINLKGKKNLSNPLDGLAARVYANLKNVVLRKTRLKFNVIINVFFKLTVSQLFQVHTVDLPGPQTTLFFSFFAPRLPSGPFSWFVTSERWHRVYGARQHA